MVNSQTCTGSGFSGDDLQGSALQLAAPTYWTIYLDIQPLIFHDYTYRTHIQLALSTIVGLEISDLFQCEL